MFLDADGVYHLYYQCWYASEASNEHQLMGFVQTILRILWQGISIGVTLHHEISITGKIKPLPSIQERKERASSLALQLSM